MLGTFINDFKTIRPESFSRFALEVLYDYLGCPDDADVIDICGTFTEYEGPEHVADELGLVFEDYNIYRYLEKRTEIVHFDDSCVIISDF